jgi:hypothetical protein
LSLPFALNEEKETYSYLAWQDAPERVFESTQLLVAMEMLCCSRKIPLLSRSADSLINIPFEVNQSKSDAFYVQLAPRMIEREVLSSSGRKCRPDRLDFQHDVALFS